ncbi:hypothetical protein C1646_769349 [Rhizophagus diaphanus]|nr:hypothetical protein C1646_769349 [Rhizophagus diaphanus] [Rhizophagus sp. MUCL 43196]
MRKSRLSTTKPFSLREGANFSGRNILSRNKNFSSLFNVGNKEGDETEFQDEMEDECNNNSREKDNDNDDNGEESDDEYDEESNDKYDEKNDDNYDEETDNDYHEENYDNYGEEYAYYDDNNNVNDVYEDKMEVDYNLEEDNIIDENDHEDTIIDSSIGNDHMSKINGSFAPYFENSTSALLFCWVQKHNISTNAYNNLVEIIHHQKFEVKDVVKNIRRLQRWRNRLPLMPIRTRTIRINPKKTPSTSKATKPCYYLSIRDIIHNILNNPSLTTRYISDQE